MNRPVWLKAAVAAVLTLLGQLALLVTGDESLGDVTDAEWIVVVLATLTTTAGVYGIKNGASADHTTSTPEV